MSYYEYQRGVNDGKQQADAAKSGEAIGVLIFAVLSLGFMFIVWTYKKYGFLKGTGILLMCSMILLGLLAFLGADTGKKKTSTSTSVTHVKKKSKHVKARRRHSENHERQNVQAESASQADDSPALVVE